MHGKWLGFAVAVAFVPGLMSGAAMPRWWVIAVGLPLAFTLDPRNIDPKIGFCLLATLAWALAIYPSMPHPHAGAFEIYLLALLGLVALAGAGEDSHLVIRGLACGVGVSAALAIPQAFGVSLVDEGWSPAGLFYNSEVLAETAAPLAVWAAWERRFTLGGLLALPILICGSRCAALAAGIGLLAGWRAPPRLVRPLLLAGLLSIGVISVLALGTNKAASGMTRITLWVTALQSITPTGGGLGWWAAAHPGARESVAHSDVLQAMVELGMGAAFLLAIPVMLLMRRDDDHAPERCAFVALCVEAAISFPLHAPTTAFMAFVLAGRLARRRAGVRDLGLGGRALARARARWPVAPVIGMVDGGGGCSSGLPLGPQRLGDGDLDQAQDRGEAVDVWAARQINL